ncbi:MAG: hypothetical protein MJE68_09280 [Proteobacteria bacterium]|nr:hypothetical protein [Pseudomonadota bacterium]
MFGGGLTIWRGTALSGCQRNEIRLRHSAYINSQATGQCNGGEIIAESVGASISENYYTSQLSLAVGEEMVNETIECLYSDLGTISETVGRRRLNLTLDGKQFSFLIFAIFEPYFVLIVPYPPPTNVHFEAWMANKNQNVIMFAWDEIIGTQCSSIQYIIFAINCGVCPNATTNTNITCVYTQPDASLDTNNTCLFAAQTEICGYLRGERSEYITVHINAHGKHCNNVCSPGSNNFIIRIR